VTVISTAIATATATKSVSNDCDEEALVEQLLAYTRQLMQGYSHHVVAFSGGVDSSLVLKLLLQAASPTDQVQAILGLSNAVSNEQLDQAKLISKHIGAPLVIVHTQEGSDDTYLANAGQACLACKTHLYSSLQAVLDHVDPATTRLYNGTNANDTQDPTRLGLLAARNFDVQSPLEFTTKEQVRRAAQQLDLPNHHTAASPCLRSRLALGVHATSEHLTMIQHAETRVRKDLTLPETMNMRVRLLTNARARVEVDANYIAQAEEFLDTWNQYFYELGFISVSIKLFQSGSVATLQGSNSSSVE
jgi:pyridinium-3,5-biscarboxylic acid mononucleotide sulfurtransferase